MSIQPKQLLLLAAVPLLIALQSCVKDTCTHMSSYTWFIPKYKTVAEVRGNIKSSPATEIKAPGKIFMYGHYIFLNEINKGVHIIDNSNPAAPVNKAFIDIPGNVDIAVKGNTLYADMYTCLVTIDITDPLNIHAVDFLENIFPDRNYGVTYNSNSIIYDWERHDTIVKADCNTGWMNAYSDRVLTLSSAISSNTSYAGGAPVGIAGSMARFALVNDHLYTVGPASMNILDISSPATPVNISMVQLPWGIETIYPFKDKLFIGSTAGMFIYSIENAATPQQLGTFEHARVCDPVVADDDYAYVTLRNGTQCQGFLNELDVVDIDNLLSPVLKKTYPMTNPHGLSKDGTTLFICDGSDGVKVFNAADVNDITLIKHISGLDTYDVIAYNGLALVVAKDGLYQFDYSSLDNIHQLSKLSIEE
ncbi:MAG: hypothetical protein QM791_23385 [Ferruginibacter sp.]